MPDPDESADVAEGVRERLGELKAEVKDLRSEVKQLNTDRRDLESRLRAAELERDGLAVSLLEAQETHEAFVAMAGTDGDGDAESGPDPGRIAENESDTNHHEDRSESAMPNEERKPSTDTELRTVLENLLQKFDGDTETVATKLIKQNIDLGTKLGVAEGKVAAAEAKASAAESKAASAIPEGHVTLPRAEADALAAYKAMGEPAKLRESLDALETYRPLGEPAKLKESLDRLPVIEKTLRDRDREAELAAVAEKAGYSPAVLKRLVADGMTFAPKTVKVRGQDVETFEVTDIDPATGKDRTRPLADVEASDWKDMLPALKVAEADERGRRPLPKGGSPYRPETRIPAPDERREREQSREPSRPMTPDMENRKIARSVAMGI